MQDVAALQSQRALLLERIAEATSETPPLVMSAAALGTKHPALFENLMADEKFRQEKRIKELRVEALRCPLPTSVPLQATLALQEVWRRPGPPMPPWASEVAIARKTRCRHCFCAPSRRGEAILGFHVCGAASFVLGSGSSGGEGLLPTHPTGHLG